MDKVIDVCGYLFIVCTICGFVVFIIEIIVSSFKMDNYIKYTDKKCVIKSNDIISLHKGSDNEDIFVLKNKTHYFFYAKTDNGYFFDKQNRTNCYIKTIDSKETPHIDTIREYTECEIVKKIPKRLYFNGDLKSTNHNVGDKYYTDEKTYHVLYIPQDSHIMLC